MIIRVQPLPRGIAVDSQAVAVVVDVLRATTVIATSLASGADAVYAVREIDDAMALRETVGDGSLLCGERHCRPIDGFDLGNSPSDYAPQVVKDRSIIMTTTNGTRALVASQNAARVFCGSFVHLSSLAAHLLQIDAPELTIVCAGTDGHETEEDLLFAGALTHRLAGSATVDLDPDARAACEMWEQHLLRSNDLFDALKQSQGGRNLVDAGYEQDVEFCATIDRFAVVPEMTGRQPLVIKRSPA